MAPKHRKVLIIESNADLAERIRIPLEEEGYMTQLAADGPDGLIRAGRYHPRVVAALVEVLSRYCSPSPARHMPVDPPSTGG